MDSTDNDIAATCANGEASDALQLSRLGNNSGRSVGSSYCTATAKGAEISVKEKTSSGGTLLGHAGTIEDLSWVKRG